MITWVLDVVLIDIDEPHTTGHSTTADAPAQGEGIIHAQTCQVRLTLRMLGYVRVQQG